MSQGEYLGIWPLFIYGLACGDLVLNWKPSRHDIHWPHLATGILLLEVLFHSFYRFWENMDNLMPGYGPFLLQMIRPLVFLAAVGYFTPPPDRHPKEYFKENIRIIFSLLVIFVIANGFLEQDFYVGRIAAIGLLGAVAITRKEWMVYLVIALRVTSQIIQLF